MRVSKQSLSKTILAVDDYADYLSMFAEIWKDDPAIKIATASNGLEALEYLKKSSPPDLIVTDLDMPVLDGFSFYRQLKSHPEWSTIAIIVISSRILCDEELSLLRGTLYLEKGSTPLEVLEQTVKKLLFG